MPVRLTVAGAADAATAAELRRALQRWLLRETRAGEEIRDDVVLGVNEALANCVEHAYHAHHTVGTMRLQAGYDPAAQSIQVCVSDRGTWQPQSARKPSDPRASRGIMLMHALADDCTINAHPGGTTVYLDYSTNRNPLGNNAS